MESKTQDLEILPPKSDSGNIKYKQDLDPRLPNVHRGICALALGVPGSGKTCLLLNILGRFLKYYYENIHFIVASKDPTMQPLFDFYGEPHKECTDTVIQNIIDSQYAQDEDEDTQYPRTNCAIIIDDALSMSSFNSRKSSKLSRLAGNFRHLLRGHLPHKEEGKDYLTSGGGGMLLLSTQRYGSTIPTSFKSCLNTLFIGRLANKKEFEEIINDYGDRVGGCDALREMINYTMQERYSFLCIYLDSDMDPETTCAVVYKNMNEKLHPTERWPEKPYQI